MSDATRAVALTQAVHVAGGNGGDAVLKLAKAFDDFLLGDDPPPKTTVPGKEPAATKAAGSSKPAPGGKKPTKTEDDLIREAVAAEAARDAAAEAAADEAEASEAAASEDPYPATKEGVQAIIAKLLQANKRKEAISLLKKFGAASATGVKTKDAGKFVAEALKILGVEQEGSDDLTA
jgi:hypothetical protein